MNSNSKGKRQCQGCQKLFDAKAFPVNSIYCTADKKAVDNLYRAVGRQSETDWWFKVKNDPLKFKVLLQEYHARCPEPAAGSKQRRKPPVILQFKEIVRSVTSTINDDVGEMMHQEAFVHWAMKPKNLGLSMDDARRKFEELRTAANAITDELGPHHSKKRVRVQVKTQVTFRNAVEKEKQYALEDKAKKDASEEDCNKALQRLFKNHEEIGNSGGTTLTEMAGLMAKSAEDQKFAGQSMMLTDVKDLLPESGEEDNPEEENGGQDDDDLFGDSVDGSATGSSVKRKGGLGSDEGGKKGQKWLCIDDAIATGLRSFSKFMDTTHANLKAAREEAQSTLDACKDASIAKQVVNEKAILETRSVALALVMDGPTPELTAFITKVKEAQDARLQASKVLGCGASSAEAGRARLGTSPPCKSYQDLVTVSRLEPYREQLHNCTTKEEIVATMKEFKDKAKSLLELCTMVKAAVRLTKACIVANKKALETACKQQVKQDKVASKSKSANAGQEIAPLWDYGPSVAKEIPACTCEQFKSDTFECAVPTIISCKVDGDGAVPLFDKKGPICAKGDSFQAKFRKSSMYSEKGRGQRPLSSELGKTITGFITKFIPESKRIDLSTCPERLQHDFKDASVFGIAKNSEHIATEIHYASAFRLTLKGSRAVVMFPFMELVGLMSAAGLTCEFTPSRMLDFGKKMSKASLDTLAEGGRLYHGTIGHGDIVFVPAGWVVAERVAANLDFVGVRVGVLMQCPIQMKMLTAISTHLADNKVPSETLACILAVSAGAPPASPNAAATDA